MLTKLSTLAALGSNSFRAILRGRVACDMAHSSRVIYPSELGIPVRIHTKSRYTNDLFYYYELSVLRKTASASRFMAIRLYSPRSRWFLALYVANPEFCSLYEQALKSSYGVYTSRLSLELQGRYPQSFGSSFGPYGVLAGVNSPNDGTWAPSPLIVKSYSEMSYVGGDLSTEVSLGGGQTPPHESAYRSGGFQIVPLLGQFQEADSGTYGGVS